MIPHFRLILTERPHRFPMKFMSESVWISMCLVASFRSCVLSWFFLWHLVWLSVMQLRHYLFIGTLNPMLNRLANNDPSLGNHQNHLFYHTHLFYQLAVIWSISAYLTPTTVYFFLLLFSHSTSPTVSQYTNAFAMTQLCGVLCAPWNGLIMDRHKGKPLAPGKNQWLVL